MGFGFVNAALHGYAVNADSTLIRRARELAQSTDRPDILLDVIWADWAGCDTGGRPDRAERLVQEAEALVADIDDPLLQAGVASMRGFSERHFGRMQSSKQYIERAIQKFTEAGEALPRQREGLLVAVDADDGGLGTALEERLGVPAHAQGAVDEHRPRRRECRGQEVDDAVAEHGYVPLVRGSP